MAEWCWKTGALIGSEPPCEPRGVGDGLANPLAAAGDKGRSSVKLQIH
jgi:hypothetical protein